MFERSTLEICVVDIRKGRWTSLAASVGKENDNKENTTTVLEEVRHFVGLSHYVNRVHHLITYFTSV